ncbi:MAG: DUF5017 domain-containing protein [Dysgonamonadaceae bacterium]|jgi:hypothetical protein|nr:DUF5017 domain-containing protein [Dysgonamonadaceae bacterium]
MKKRNLIILGLCFLFASCEEETLNTPQASFEISDTEVSVNQTVTFTFTGSEAKQVVVFTGDEGHDYELREQSNSGLTMSKGILSYSYKKPGNYKIVLIAVNYDKEGDRILEAKAETNLVVSDTRTGLKVIALRRDMFTKEIQGDRIDDVILFAVPYKVRLRNRDNAVNLTKQRLDITAESESATLWLNDTEYSDKTNYDLTQSPVLKIRAGSGDEESYNLRTINYPVFETFSINGVAGTVAYDDYNFNKTHITLTLPAGTDKSALIATFTSADAQEVTVGETIQVSGLTANNFDRTLVYTLKTADPDNNRLQCESTVEVTVN